MQCNNKGVQIRALPRGVDVLDTQADRWIAQTVVTQGKQKYTEYGTLDLASQELRWYPVWP